MSLDQTSTDLGDSKEHSIVGAELVKKEFLLGSNVFEKETPIMLMEKEIPIGASHPNSTNGGETVGKETPVGQCTQNSSDDDELAKKQSPSGSNPNSESETNSCAEVLNLAREREKEQLEQTISSLEEDVACLEQRHRSSEDKRRESLNKILDLKGTIRVFCRIRPFSPRDKRTTHQPITVESEKVIVKSAGSKKEFGFDKVFPEEATQEHVYVEVEPILRSALDGRNVCILAYGQSGTGKTFTMVPTVLNMLDVESPYPDNFSRACIQYSAFNILNQSEPRHPSVCCSSSESTIQDGTNESPGILPRALEEIFRLASLNRNASVSFSISMLEVYLGSLRDLLAQKSSRRVYAVSKCNLNIQTDSKGSVEIDGLTEVEVSNLTKARWWYNKGRRARSTSWTNVNEASSRSHCLTRITINQPSDQLGGKSEVSKIWLVDLGGSERLLKTGATGPTLDEGRAINLSLSALADVIAALRRKKGHVPYRNSKLTQILRDSLGDGSKVVMLVHISPCKEDVGETTYSSTFAKRARAVESIKELPEDARKLKEKKVAEIESEMKEAEEECLKVKNQIQKLELTLKENKRLLTMNNKLLAKEEGEFAQLSPIDNNKKNNNTKHVLEQTPLITEKTIRRNSNNCLPRFMNPTVASLERQSASDREIDGRIRILRSGTRQSFSYPDSRFKFMLKHPNKKSRYAESTTTDVCAVLLL